MEQYKTLTPVSFSTELTLTSDSKSFQNHPEDVRCNFFLPPRQGFQREIFCYLLNDVIYRRPWNISLFIFVSKSIGWNFFLFFFCYLLLSQLTMTCYSLDISEWKLEFFRRCLLSTPGNFLTEWSWGGYVLSDT